MTRITTHPGEVLREEFLIPITMTGNALALELHVPPNRISMILTGERAVTADTALRLSRYFGTTPGFWMNLQNAYDLSKVEAEIGDRLDREVRVRASPDQPTPQATVS